VIDAVIAGGVLEVDDTLRYHHRADQHWKWLGQPSSCSRLYGSIRAYRRLWSMARWVELFRYITCHAAPAAFLLWWWTSSTAQMFTEVFTGFKSRRGVNNKALTPVFSPTPGFDGPLGLRIDVGLPVCSKSSTCCADHEA